MRHGDRLRPVGAAYHRAVRGGVVVVGAGLAGLACAAELAAADVPVTVRERARVSGGRLAGRRFDGRPVDIGAAYFTVSDDAFGNIVDRWHRAGLARRWTDTFTVFAPSGRGTTTGPMRWAAPHGLRSLAEDLARQLPVALERPVTAVGPGPTVDGQPARAVVLAMPGPQAARLLHEDLPETAHAASRQRWSPALSAVLRYPERTWTDFSGAFVNDHPVLATVCDDGDRRGDAAPVLVAHTTPEFARARLADPASAADPVRRAVAEVLDLPQLDARVFVHRWSFAQPEPAVDAESYFLGAEDVALAGDAFGTPRVQTAWLSGRALGRALAERLGRPS